MGDMTESSTPSQKSGFFREGWHEIGRRLQRSKLRKQSQAQSKERIAALERLGRQGWQEKIDLSAFHDLRDQLSRLDSRAGELTATTKKLDDDRAALSARQTAETAKFDTQRKAVEERKRPVDSALKVARDRRTEQDRTIKRLEGRQTSGAAALASLEQKLNALSTGATPVQSAQQSADQSKREQLSLEQQHLTEELALARQSLPPLDAEIQRLTAESKSFDAELARIESERKTVLSPIAAELTRMKGESTAAIKQTGTVEKERSGLYADLGKALYDRKSLESGLAENIAQIAAIDRTITAQQAALDASLALTRAMPSGTMVKFIGILVFVPLFIIGLGLGTYLGIAWWKARHRPPEYDATQPVNPYLSHPLRNNPAYVLANRLVDARNENAVADRMLESFRTLHLGVYTPEGKQILAGAERSDKDFFLYDFHWKILARAFFQRNVLSFDDQSAILGRAMLGLQDPAKFRPVLSHMLLHRYQEAAKRPDDLMSFLILLVDGLARRQIKPYSLSEMTTRPPKDLYIDPVQSFLIMLDSFTQPPQSGATPTTMNWIPPTWSLVPTVHADSPCSEVKGDGASGFWGAAKDNAPSVLDTGGEIAASELSAVEAKEIAEKVSNLGKVVGAGLDTSSGVDDLLTLWGINIHIQPQPYVVHLRHDSVVRIKFTATVNLDTLTTSDAPVPCGAMAGKKIGTPPNPMKDVELTWNVEPEWPPYLIVPSDVVAKMTGHLGFQTNTDENGKSEFALEATDCPNKQGKIVGRDFMMTASARVLTRKIPSPATGVEGPLAIISLIAKLGPSGLEYLMNGRTGYARFRVEWHITPPKVGQY